jgi:hypothetical protein
LKVENYWELMRLGYLVHEMRKRWLMGLFLLLFRLVTTSARQSQDAWWGSTDWTEVEVGGIY